MNEQPNRSQEHSSASKRDKPQQQRTFPLEKLKSFIKFPEFSEPFGLFRHNDEPSSL